MALHENLQSMKFDKRLVNWNLEHNVISSQDYEQFLGSLEDISEKGTTMDQVVSNQSVSESSPDDTIENLNIPAR